MKVKKFNIRLSMTLLVMIFCLALPFASACDNKIASGSLRTLQEAFDCGLLTSIDIKDISYYMLDSVYEYDECDDKTDIVKIYEIDYTPSTMLASLSQSEIKAIKYAYYLEEIDLFNVDYSDFNSCETDISISFYGEYNGSYVVKIEVVGWAYITSIEEYYFEGTYLETPYPLLEVFMFDS